MFGCIFLKKQFWVLVWDLVQKKILKSGLILTKRARCGLGQKGVFGGGWGGTVILHGLVVWPLTTNCWSKDSRFKCFRQAKKWGYFSAHHIQNIQFLLSSENGCLSPKSVQGTITVYMFCHCRVFNFGFRIALFALFCLDNVGH